MRSPLKRTIARSPMHYYLLGGAIGLISLAPVVLNAANDDLYIAQPVTQSGEFTSGIEGPACDAKGHLYAVNFAKQGTIGIVSPGKESDVFLALPADSVGNGIRFDQMGRMYIADYVNHNIWRVDVNSQKPTLFAHNSKMSQPNDLAIAANGTLYASDPNWGAKTGQIWKISPEGQVKQVASEMGTTNGIEVSIDNQTLYVNESLQRNIWAFDIASNGTLSNKRLLKKFADHGFDGMRGDIDGNLYVTRHGKGTVVKLSPQGELLQEIDVLGDHPTNICFGGPDGRTAYVTEAQNKRIVSFRVEKPGRSWQLFKNTKN